MAVDVDQAKEILTASPKIPNLNPNGARGFIFPVELTSDKWCCSLAHCPNVAMVNAKEITWYLEKECSVSGSKGLILNPVRVNRIFFVYFFNLGHQRP